jgi:hypothetical protein
MTLSVIGAGYPRTGTASLKLALEQLGLGPCHHMREVIANPSSAQLWVEAAQGRPDWGAIFKGYRSCTDAPGCTFWRQLSEVYPEAKILLSVRDPEAWFESTQTTVFGPMMTARMAGTPLEGLETFFKLCVYKDFGDRINERAFMLEQFARHTEEVKRQAPPERLLVYDVGEGWGPLCAFLGVEVPDGPFPKTNTRAEIVARRAAMLAAAGQASGS